MPLTSTTLHALGSDARVVDAKAGATFVETVAYTNLTPGIQNACDIVEHNPIVPETIGEYAEMLESQGLSDVAAGYRAWHKEFTEALAQYDLPARGYEARLRIEAMWQYKRADAS